MVFGLATKIALIALVPVGVAGVGVGGFYAADGTLEATLIDKDCAGSPEDFQDDSQGSRLKLEVDLIGLKEWVPQIPNNMCHQLETGDVATFALKSQHFVITDADGQCKYDSEEGEPKPDPSTGSLSNC